MKAIFVISAMNGGGAERVLATLANRYVQQGDEVTILMVAGDESAYPLDEKVNILSIGQPSHGNPLVQVKRLLAMRKYFKRHREWVIVSFGTEINYFGRATTGRAVKCVRTLQCVRQDASHEATPRVARPEIGF